MCDLLGFIMFYISTVMYFIMFLVVDYLPPSALHTLTCLESVIRSLVVCLSLPRVHPHYLIHPHLPKVRSVREGP